MCMCMQDMRLWNPIKGSKGVTCYEGVGDQPAARGEGVIPFPPRVILEYLQDPSSAKDRDAGIDVSRCVERLDEQVRCACHVCVCV